MTPEIQRKFRGIKATAELATTETNKQFVIDAAESLNRQVAELRTMVYKDTETRSLL